MTWPSLAGSLLNFASCQSPTDSKMIPMAASAVPIQASQPSAAGSAATCPSCTGNDTTHSRMACRPNTLVRLNRCTLPGALFNRAT